MSLHSIVVKIEEAFQDIGEEIDKLTATGGPVDRVMPSVKAILDAVAAHVKALHGLAGVVDQLQPTTPVGQPAVSGSAPIEPLVPPQA